MNVRKMLKLFLAMAVVSVLLFVTACGGGSDDTAADTGNNATTETDSGTTDTTPDTDTNATVDTDGINRDGILVFGGSGWAGIFNSIMSNNLYDRYVTDIVKEGLISNNAAGEPVPKIALSWEISNENRTYTFFMDPRAAFSDGTPVTAHDVSFTFHTIAHPLYDGPRYNAVQDLLGVEAFTAGEADSVEGIRVIDDHTIEFTHVNSSPQHIWNFGYGILSEAYYAFGDDWDHFMSLIDRPFGSGQYVFVDYVFQQWIEFERNENYWNPDVQINLAGVIMREVPNESIVPAVIAGEIHIGEAPVNLDNLEALQAAPNVHPNLFVANTLRQITFNTLRPQLEDHRVRQALVYAFDTHAYIVADTGSPDLRSVGTSPFSPVSWAQPPVGTLNEYEFNMERAHELMDEAGWLMADDGFRYKDGERMRLEWIIYHEAAWPGIITGLASQTWGELGVELDIQMMDFATVNSFTSDLPVGEKQFDIYQMGWSMAIDPDLRGGLWDGSESQIHGGSFFNSGWRDERLMELIERGAEEFDQAERTRIYHEIAEITNYYLPVWVLSNGRNLWPIATSVHNLENSAFYSWTNALITDTPWIE